MLVGDVKGYAVVASQFRGLQSRSLLIRSQTVEAASLVLTRLRHASNARRLKSKLTRAAQQHDKPFHISMSDRWSLSTWLLARS
jgi:hypothetical protein